MEDARETRGLNLKLCFRGIKQLAMADEVGPVPLSAAQTVGGQRCWSIASLGDEMPQGRGGPWEPRPSPPPGPVPLPGRRVQPVGTGSEGDRLSCRLVPPPTLEEA